MRVERAEPRISPNRGVLFLTEDERRLVVNTRCEQRPTMYAVPQMPPVITLGTASVTSTVSAEICSL